MPYFRVTTTRVSRYVDEFASREDVERISKMVREFSRDDILSVRIESVSGVSIPENRTPDTVTAEEWEAAGEAERADFYARVPRGLWPSRKCPECSFPCAFFWCEVCSRIGKRIREMVRSGELPDVVYSHDLCRLVNGNADGYPLDEVQHCLRRAGYEARDSFGYRFEKKREA